MIKPHGADDLRPLFVYDTVSHDALIREAEHLPSLLISSAAAANAVMLGAGYFTPLTGYMNLADSLSVAEHLKTQDGLFWPVPIVNMVDDISAIEGERRIALRDPNVDGHPVLAIMDVEAIEVAAPSAGSVSQPVVADSAGILAKASAKLRERESARAPEAAAALDKELGDIAKTRAITGLRVGQKAPDFTLPNERGNTVTLYEELKKGPVVVVFYWGEWCPFCNLQLRALEKSYLDIKKAGASLVAISPQKQAGTVKQKRQHKLSFPLLTDYLGRTLKAYGLVYDVPKEMQATLGDLYGVDLASTQASGRAELPVTATYIIAPNGTVTAAVVDFDYTRRMEPAEILKVLQGM